MFASSVSPCNTVKSASCPIPLPHTPFLGSVGCIPVLYEFRSLVDEDEEMGCHIVFASQPTLTYLERLKGYVYIYIKSFQLKQKSLWETESHFQWVSSSLLFVNPFSKTNLCIWQGGILTLKTSLHSVDSLDFRGLLARICTTSCSLLCNWVQRRSMQLDHLLIS